MVHYDKLKTKKGKENEVKIFANYNSKNGKLFAGAIINMPTEQQGRQRKQQGWTMSKQHLAI